MVRIPGYLQPSTNILKSPMIGTVNEEIPRRDSISLSEGEKYFSGDYVVDEKHRTIGVTDDGCGN